MKYNVPIKMKALHQLGPLPEDAISNPDEIKKYIKLTEIDVPKPGPGQVLVKVNRGLVNSDITLIPFLFFPDSGCPGK
ncbi:hypothetical protein LPTSP3_g24560 [Leptospira kobayashii]|uniref:Alcohol dehydrogenase n=1 Tax=Leptospira kobayashii TaxID=1917830 RepID=A0ABN6KHX1_9LEPT|nr:hypothetical protein [Leptospira kobayashii]BDA79526.1 hypothetical protein LPTSP3_g24560 [Leptospira kobayashii]